MQRDDSTRYETEQQTAERLNIPVATLRTWRSRGGGPPFCRFGRLVRYSVQETERWAESRRVKV
jgi:hypothetical protein